MDKRCFLQVDKLKKKKKNSYQCRTISRKYFFLILKRNFFAIEKKCKKNLRTFIDLYVSPSCTEERATWNADAIYTRREKLQRAATRE